MLQQQQGKFHFWTFSFTSNETNFGERKVFPSFQGETSGESFHLLLIAIIDSDMIKIESNRRMNLPSKEKIDD